MMSGVTTAMTSGDASGAEDALEVARRCDNRGRWGAEDQLGTLNLITPERRVDAAGLVRTGEVVSLAKPLDEEPSAVNPRPAWHVMHLETERPYASADGLHLLVHGLASTHLDALGHMYLDGVGYNGFRQDDLVQMSGLAALDVSAMSHGILTRGILLDVAAAVGVPWLEPGVVVDAAMLDAAAALHGIEVRPGDAVVVHVGLERREAQEGAENPATRAGLDLSAVAWLHDHDVALYTGDCIERFPETPGPVPMPLHQIGIARMGLALLDAPTLTALVSTCEQLDRWTFLLTMAPLVVRGGTGSPVNPIAVF